MAADTSSRPGALVEQPQRPKGIPEAERARRRGRLQAEAEAPTPPPPAVAGDTTAELSPPASLAAELEAGDRQVQRIGTLCSVPRLAVEAQELATDAALLDRLVDQLVDVRLQVEARRPVPGRQLLDLGTTLRAWLTARSISESDATGAA